MRVSEATITAMLELLRVGLAGGVLSIYGSPIPESTEDPPEGDALGTLILANPAAPPPVRGVLTFAPIQEDWSAAGTGEARWARMLGSDFAIDLTVGEVGSGADCEINSTEIHEGGPIRVLSARIALRCS